MMKPKLTISDREIKKQLAGFREQVAAPRDFRAAILRQLAAETGQAAPEQGQPLWQRLLDLVTRPFVVPALASVAALAFGLWFAGLPRTLPEARPASEQLSLAPQPDSPLPKVKRSSQIAKKIRSSAHTSEIAAVREQPGVSVQQSAPAAGSASEATAVTQSKFSVLPTAVTEPSVVPSQGVLLGSQVRRNRFLASRGEYTAILVALKAPGRVRVECFDRSGKSIAVLHDADAAAGVFELRWHGHDQNGQLAPTGIYALRVMTSEYNETHKIVVVR